MMCVLWVRICDAHDLRHGEADAEELLSVKRALGKAHHMVHPDFPKKKAPPMVTSVFLGCLGGCVCV